MARIWKFGANVDTDQIVPGRYAPYMRPDADVGDAAFIEARPEFASEARPGDLIVAGANFGCGSSREYAPEALVRRRIGAVIAVSFARIFYRNAVNLGIPVVVSPDIAEALEDGVEVTFSYDRRRIETPVAAWTFAEPAPFVDEIIRAGGIVNYVREHGRFPGVASP